MVVLLLRYWLTTIIVPITVVFTKYDLLVQAAELELRPKKSDNEDDDTFQQRCLKKAHNDFRTHCERKFRKNSRVQINCVFVASVFPLCAAKCHLNTSYLQGECLKLYKNWSKSPVSILGPLEDSHQRRRSLSSRIDG